jgi:hypothetical protein
MRRLRIPGLVLVLPLLLVVSMGCDEETPVVPPQTHLEIVSASIADGDTIGTHASLAFLFSAPLDTASFQATSLEPLVPVNAESEIPDTLWMVHDSAIVLLDGLPLSFIYDPSGPGIAIFEYATIDMPAGTGEGLTLQAGEHQLTLGDGFVSAGGLTMTESLEAAFFARTQSTFNPVPNPFYYGQGYESGNYLAFVTEDPRAGTLRILDLGGMEILEKTFTPVLDGFLDDRKVQGGAISQYVFNLVISRTLKSGVYSFELEYAADDFRRGYFVMLIGR